MRTVIVTDRLHREGAWRLVERGEAIFHSFGLDYEEFSDGAFGYSIAIVEWPDGSVEMVRADRVRFVSPSTAQAGEKQDG